jgi:hypothetical protein
MADATVEPADPEWEEGQEHIPSPPQERKPLPLLPKQIRPIPSLQRNALALISLFKEETPGNVLLQASQVSTIMYGFVDASGSGFGRSTITLRNAADNRILYTFYCREKNRFNWTRYVSFYKEGVSQ